MKWLTGYIPSSEFEQTIIIIKARAPICHLLITQQEETIPFSVVYYIPFIGHLWRQRRLLLPWGSYSACPEKKLQSMDSQTTTAKRWQPVEGKKLQWGTGREKNSKGQQRSRQPYQQLSKPLKWQEGSTHPWEHRSRVFFLFCFVFFFSGFQF